MVVYLPSTNTVKVKPVVTRNFSRSNPVKSIIDSAGAAVFGFHARRRRAKIPQRTVKLCNDISSFSATLTIMLANTLSHSVLPLRHATREWRFIAR